MAFNPVTLILFFLSLIPGATLTPRTCDPPFRGPWQTTYDVFLSFRGGDTRKHFTDHLYKALTRAGIPTFRDDDEIRIGENIELEIQKAIQESKSYIIVFSKNYSSSRWCLDELSMIMERRRTVGHLVFPVFYDVDPSEVGNQTGQFGEEFAKLEVRFKYQMERVEGWRTALKEAANMERMVLEDRYESKFIESIVKEIADKLNLSRPHVPPSSVPLSSALRPLSYFFGLLREWRRSFFRTPSLFLFFLTLLSSSVEGS
ncbi:toll/interleukin-1 receptor-like protein isoform X1 [Populus alba]|uniref:toll/interleukin-1 receptor-like protein isoform X1 n=1 Tax=Populus alba TaxID=43335 RepID=UPI00158F1B49|nr:disease resistance protein RPV1-like [Populus alba]